MFKDSPSKKDEATNPKEGNNMILTFDARFFVRCVGIIGEVPATDSRRVGSRKRPPNMRSRLIRCENDAQVSVDGRLLCEACADIERTKETT